MDLNETTFATSSAISYNLNKCNNICIHQTSNSNMNSLHNNTKIGILR